MNDLEKQIEEAAYKYGNKINSHVGDNNFIVGAKSPEAKQYWQQGMYSEEEVEILCLKAINDSLTSVNRFMNNSDCELIDQNIWFEQNKKKQS